jgi:hypothetical protein
MGVWCMTSALLKAFQLVLTGLTFVATAATVIAQEQPQGAYAAADPASSKRSSAKTETVIGSLSGVDPVKGLVIVTRRGPHEPPSLQLSWTESTSSETGGRTEKGPITVSQGPGETTYDFKVTASTSILVNGVQSSVGSLAKYQNAKTTVRFTPKHDGNFALEIRVSH